MLVVWLQDKPSHMTDDTHPGHLNAHNIQPRSYGGGVSYMLQHLGPPPPQTGSIPPRAPCGSGVGVWGVACTPVLLQPLCIDYTI